MALIWTALIYIACLIPGSDIPEVNVPLIDKWVHFALFSGFAFLWLCSLSSTNTKKGIFVFIAAALVGLSVELLQESGITSGRYFEWNDVLADSIGGILGVVVFFLLRKTTLRKNT
jgi:VanZ family protein